MHAAIHRRTEYEQYSLVELSDTPDKAAVAHFDGPLTVYPRTNSGKVSSDLVLVTGEKPTELMADIGTQHAERGCWVVVRTHHRETSTFPKAVFPLVDVEFPPKTPGGAPVKKTYQLDKFC